MNRGLLFLNGGLLVLTIYTAISSWSVAEFILIILFGASFSLLLTKDSRIGNLILLLSNSIVAAIGILLALVATFGGLVTYGPGAIASLVLLAPTAVFVANAVYGKKQLALAN